MPVLISNQTSNANTNERQEQITEFEEGRQVSPIPAKEPVVTS